MDDLVLLSKHRFGNYVIQKIVEHSSSNIRTLIFECLTPYTLEMCYDKFGCRVI